jgi:hypothetical protein
VVTLHHGAIALGSPAAVSAPADTLTPFGFTALPDGTAVISLAHSSDHGLFRDGAFVSVIEAGQAAPCWVDARGKYVYAANTVSHTISRLVSTGSNIFVDALAAATITTGGNPTDVDASAEVLGVIDHGGGMSHLSLFALNEFGELSAIGTPINLGIPKRERHRHHGAGE